MSAWESRTSPVRGGSCTGASFVPTTSPMMELSSRTLTRRPPPPTFITRPGASGAVPARTTASAVSVTKLKSRVWPPSPWIVAGRFASAASMKSGTTAAYRERGDCRGPYTLKNLSATPSSPNEALKAWM